MSYLDIPVTLVSGSVYDRCRNVEDGLCHLQDSPKELID